MLRVQDLADWNVITGRHSGYFPLLSGADLTTTNWKREMAYEGDPPILSISILPGRGEREGRDQFEALINQDIPDNSAVADVVATLQQINEEGSDDIVGQLHEVLGIATTADDDFANSTSILFDGDLSRQEERRTCSQFFSALSLEHPCRVSLTRGQAAELRLSSSKAASISWEE